MRRGQRRAAEQFSVSFLDVASCGFGAIIILLMITRSDIQAINDNVELLPSGVIVELQRQLFAIRSETTEMREELNDFEDRNATLEELLSDLRGQRDTLEDLYQRAELQGEETAQAIGELLTARQTLTEEMRRLYANISDPPNNFIGGVPMDSEYIVFVIDTSGSMVSNAWPRVLEVIEETLNVYPEVKGIQVLNDMGQYMFTLYERQWIPDTPERRRQIISLLRNWTPYSNSSPVEGLREAIGTFYSEDQKISVYVIGDDFSSGSIESVLREVARYNYREDDVRVRIHGIGFPVILGAIQESGYNYAALMRDLTQRNGGTFVGLNDFR